MSANRLLSEEEQTFCDPHPLFNEDAPRWRAADPCEGADVAPLRPSMPHDRQGRPHQHRSLLAPSILAVLIGQGMKKGHQRRLLVTIQEQRPDQGREIGIGPSSSAVELHDIFERGEASVVHVWGRPCTVAQRRRTKRSPLSPDQRKLVATRISKSAISVANTQIVEPEVHQ